MKCPKCQSENRDGIKFCEDCGKKLPYKQHLCMGCKLKRFKKNVKWEIKKITFLIILGFLIWAYLENKLPKPDDLLKNLPLDQISETIDQYTYKTL